MISVVRNYYNRHSNPLIVLDIIEDCLGFRLQEKKPPKINWYKNILIFILLGTSLIRFALFWFYWDQEPDELAIIVKWWQMPKMLIVGGFLVLYIYPMSSRAFCLYSVANRDRDFKLIMKPFKIVGGLNQPTDLLDCNYNLFVVNKIKTIIFIHETFRRLIVAILIPVYWLGPVEGKALKTFVYRFLWSFHHCFSVTQTLKQIMCVMMVIYVNCLTVYYILMKRWIGHSGDDVQNGVGAFCQTFTNLVHGLTWLGRSNRPMRVLIGLLVLCTWTVSILALFLLTIHRPPLFIHAAAVIMSIEISGCLLIILITVSFVSHKIQKTIRSLLYRLPEQVIDIKLRMKFNNVLALSMTRNAFSCFDFFEIQQQFILVAIWGLTKYYMLLFKKIRDKLD